MDKKFLRTFRFFAYLYILIVVFFFVVNGGVIDYCGSPFWKSVKYVLLGGFIIAWLLGVYNRFKHRDFKTIFLWLIIGALGVAIGLLAGSGYSRGSPQNPDGRRAANLRQIQTALELYYGAEREYPASLELLVEEGYLEMESNLADPETGNSYCYAYGVDKKVRGEVDILYYHLGAVLDNEESDLLANDDDFDSTGEFSGIDWYIDISNKGDCSFEHGGFDGREESTGVPLYDVAVKPSSD